jgi:hypothetical protein
MSAFHPNLPLAANVCFRPIADASQVKQFDVMRLRTLFAVLLCACIAAQFASAAPGSRQAWFYSTTDLRSSTAPVTWCSFVTKASAEAAANGDRFTPVESGSLRYRGNAIESLTIMSQSEDAFVEDRYTFGPDFAVKQVARRGHYVSDPFATATFRPDGRGRLRMTADSRRRLRSWKHTTYFLEWPLYETFAQIPFAGLIRIKPSIAVSEACRQVAG